MLSLTSLTRLADAMNLLVIFAVLCCAFPVTEEAVQQCVSCSSSACHESNPKTKSCDEKCYTILLRKKSPDEKDPFAVKGCTSDSLFYRRSCVNKCYEKKREFGSSMYYMCVHCCTGDKCNAGSRKKSGGIFVVVSATFVAVLKCLYN